MLFNNSVSKRPRHSMQDHHNDPPRTRQEALNIIRRTYDAIKWPWLAIMSFALTTATISLSDVLFRTPSNFFDALLGFLLYVLLFVRFFIGDGRYLDLFEHKAVKAYLDEDDDTLGRIFSVRRRTIDTFSLLIHGVIFVFLAQTISKPLYFIITCGILLSYNLCWLYYVTNARVLRTRKTIPAGELDDEHDKIVIRKEKIDRAPEKWVIINLISVIILGALFYSKSQGVFTLSDDVFNYICYSLILANTLVDFAVTWSFYFPSCLVLFDRKLIKQNEANRKTAHPTAGNVPP